MYDCIDGVGPELAATLYEVYRWMADPLEASVPDLEGSTGSARSERGRYTPRFGEPIDSAARFGTFRSFHDVLPGSMERNRPPVQ